MNNEIANKVFEILEQVAEQLGIAAEKLYPVLLRQARIDAYGNIAGLIISLIVGLAFVYVAYRFFNNYEIFLAVISSTIALLSLAYFSVILIGIKYFVLTPLLNPDWYIIKELLAKLIK